MPAAFKLDKLDSPGIAEILKSPAMAAVVRSTAQAVAAGVRQQQPSADVVVDSYTTDRAASSVTVRDLRAKLWQVRDGLLTRAAGGVGLEVKAK